MATFVPAPAFASSSASVRVTILGDATTTTLTSAHNPAGSTDLVAYTVTVTVTPPPSFTSSAPTGTITLTDADALLASGPLTPISTTTSTVTLTAADPSVGARSLVATYTPATPTLVASTGTLLETITAVPTPAVTLTATPNPAAITSSLVLSTRLTNVPTGAILALLDGATPLPLSTSTTAATYTLPAGTLNIGSHTLSAVLRDGHGNLLASSAPVLEHITGLTSTLILRASPAHSILVGTPVALAASLTSTIPSGHTPNGSVTFLDGTLVLGSAPVDPTGHASLLTSSLTTGTHTLSATWSGDDLLSSATAPSLTEQILANPTATSLTVATLGTTAFAPVTLIAQVTSPSGPPINTAVCTPACAPIAVTFSAQTSTGITTLGTASVDTTGRATLSVQPHAGPITFAAAFSGSPLFSPSTSATAADTIALAPTSLSLAGSPNPLYQRGSVTLTAGLSAATGIPATALTSAPITLLEGSTRLGTITSPSGTLTYTPTTGTHTLTATFPGTADLAPASATLVITVLASDFTLTLQDTALTIPTEHHALTTATVAISGDLADTIDLTCDKPPSIISCTFTPATMALSPNGTLSTTAQLIVDTDFIQRWANLRRPTAFDPNAPALPALAATLALSLPTTWLLTLRRRRPDASNERTHPHRGRSPLPNLLAVFLLATLALGMSACGSTQPGHTPPGTYPLTITAHARTHNYSHTATLTLTITP